MTTPTRRPAPQFRPPQKRQPKRSSRFDRKLAGIVAGLVVLLLIAGGLAFALTRGGDDDNGTTPAGGESQSTGGTAGGPDSVLPGPASRYVPALNEVPPGYEVYPQNTLSLTEAQFVADNIGIFDSYQGGEAKAAEWGFMDGYRAEFWPTGQLAEVVTGPPIYTIDVYLFEQTVGARAAFDQFQQSYTNFPGTQPIDAHQLGNQSGAWALPQGKVGTSDVDAIYHRFAYRRGNMIVLVQTLGGVPFMSIDKAREMARIADERALGERAQTTPTPSAQQNIIPPTPTP